MNKVLCFILCLCGLFAANAQQTPVEYFEIENAFNEGDFEKCIKASSEIENLIKLRTDTIAANCLYYLAEAHIAVGNLTKGIEYYEREKNLRETHLTQYPVEYSNTLFNLAYWYLQAAQYAKALTNAEAVLSNDKKLYKVESQEYVNSVLNIADIYIQLDRFKELEQLLQNTLKKQAKGSLSHGLLLNKLGDLYLYAQQYSMSQKALEEAVEILFDAAGENSGEYATAAINLGVLYMQQGKYPEAEEIFEVAANIVDPSSVAYNGVLNNQALVLQNLGQLERSEKIFKKIKALDSAAIGTSHPDYAITLANLGQLLAQEGKFNEAEGALKTALDIQKKNKEANTISYGKKLHNLARVYTSAGQPDKAIPILKQSLEIFRKNLGENNPQYAANLYSLGNAYWKAGKDSEAIKYLKQSASIRAKVLGKKHPHYAESVLKIAEFQWYQKQLNEASQSFGEVFDNYYFQIDETFPGLTEEEKTQFYYTSIKDGFEKFNSFASMFGKESPQLVGNLYNYHINTKGAIIVATEKVKKAILGSGDSTLINLFQNWQEQKEAIARSYSQNVDQIHLDSLLKKANELEKELSRRSSVFENHFNRTLYAWQDIQQKLKPGEAAIEIVRFKKYSPEAGGKFTEHVNYAFLILTPQTSKNPELIILDRGTDLENKFLKFYHNNIQYQLDDAYSYKNYFEPVADLLKKHNATRLYVSADGVYNQVNLNTIRNPFTQKFLVDEYDINLVTNTVELLNPEVQTITSAKSTLIGFPKFNLEKQGETLVAQAGQKRGTTRGLTRGMRGLLRLMRGEEGISELPGTQKEIQEISKLFPTTPEIYLAHEASEDITKQVDNPTFLHIATHGYFLADDETLGNGESQYVTNPLLKAGLILAGAENFIRTGEPVNNAGDDGILTAYEAMNLKLEGTQLVVLSACETGLGEVKNGEGVYGLQRALRLAGTKSVVMSLWSVDDDATQELMSTFYTELMKSGDQHESFRTAQQKIKEKYKNPFYWGAFIMVGI